jgi:hypothetical protein
MRSLILVLVSFSLYGCSTAYWMDKTYEPQKGGIVGYRNEGWGISKRAEEAKQLMASFCAPQSFRVVSESNKQADAGMVYGNGYAAPVSEDHLAVKFVCN